MYRHLWVRPFTLIVHVCIRQLTAHLPFTGLRFRRGLPVKEQALREKEQAVIDKEEALRQKEEVLREKEEEIAQLRQQVGIYHVRCCI